MNRKVFIRIIAVCSILLVAEIVLLLAVFNRKQKKKDSSGGLNSEKPEVTQAPTTVIPKPTQEAERKLKEWEELTADDPGIQYDPDFQEVWRVTGQKFYTLNDDFSWLIQSRESFLEEPVLWSKGIDPETVKNTQIDQRLNDIIVYGYDDNGCLSFYRENLNLSYELNTPLEYTLPYDELFSPLEEIAFSAPTNVLPTFLYEYRYNRDGDVVHKWVTISDPYWQSYFFADTGFYPEYKYYYWEDGQLAKWEGYSADGILREEVQVTYIMDSAGRISEYREESDRRFIQTEYIYNSNGVLTEIHESYRSYYKSCYGYDTTRQYNETGELIAKHEVFCDVDPVSKAETQSEWGEEYDFHASEDGKGQRVADFMLYGVDGYAWQYGQYHREYVYDDAGNVIERLTYMDGLLLYREEITYEQVKVPRRNLTEEERIRLRIYD